MSFGFKLPGAFLAAEVNEASVFVFASYQVNGACKASAKQVVAKVQRSFKNLIASAFEMALLLLLYWGGVKERENNDGPIPNHTASKQGQQKGLLLMESLSLKPSIPIHTLCK